MCWDVVFNLIILTSCGASSFFMLANPAAVKQDIILIIIKETKEQESVQTQDPKPTTS